MRPALALVAIACCLSYLPAGTGFVVQDPEAEAQVQRRAATLLIRYADFCVRNKVGPKARRALWDVIQIYHKDHKNARSKLGR